MTEDFIGKGGKLEEMFVEATDKTLTAEVFTPLETRAAKEKPVLMPGLASLKDILGEADFDKFINPIQNINLGNNAMLIVTGNEQLRTILMGKYLPVLRKAFKVDNVKIIGGGRYGVDAF